MSVIEQTRKIPVTRLLEVWQVDALAQSAKEDDKSESEVLREAVDSYLTARQEQSA